jgi:hypothetical protein
MWFLALSCEHATSKRPSFPVVIPEMNVSLSKLDICFKFASGTPGSREGGKVTNLSQYLLGGEFR